MRFWQKPATASPKTSVQPRHPSDRTASPQSTKSRGASPSHVACGMRALHDGDQFFSSDQPDGPTEYRPCLRPPHGAQRGKAPAHDAIKLCHSFCPTRVAMPKPWSYVNATVRIGRHGLDPLGHAEREIGGCPMVDSSPSAFGVQLTHCARLVDPVAIQ